MYNQAHALAPSSFLRPVLQRYSLAVMSVFIAALFTAVLESPPRFIFFVAAVVVSARYGGFKPGLFATLLSLVIINFSFLSPNLENILLFMAFLVVGSVISWLEETRKTGENTLRKSEALFRATQELSLYGFTVLQAVRDIQGKVVDLRCTYVNRAAAQILKTPQEQLCGVRLIKHNPLLKEEHGDILARYIEVIETGKSLDTEIFYQSQQLSGWFRVMAVKLDDGVAVSFSDITKRRRDEERAIILQEVTAALSQALTFDEVLTVIIDRACIAVQGHYGAVGIIERQMLEVAKATHSLLDDDSYYASLPLDRSSAMSDAVLSQAPVWIQSQAEYIERYPAYTDGAKTINLQALAALPLRINEQISGSIMIGFPQPQTIVEEDRRFLMTLADYCAQAIERARLYEAERQARQEAETANKLKLQFLGMISHELRTPLTSIKGFATTLLAPDVTFDAPTQREFIGIMDTESDRLAGLIDQLLDLTRLQAGSLPIHRKVQPFDTVLRLAKVRLDILTRNHPLVIDLPPDLPLLLVDGERIAQVLVNLVGNSVKFSPPGSCITVTAGMLEGQVLITVHDQGIGIPVEAREYIFEAFRQIEREKPHEIKGAGLGLAICKGLIDAHGGRIWVRHHDGGGAVICFTLPPAAG